MHYRPVVILLTVEGSVSSTPVIGFGHGRELRGLEIQWMKLVYFTILGISNANSVEEPCSSFLAMNGLLSKDGRLFVGIYFFVSDADRTDDDELKIEYMV